MHTYVFVQGEIKEEESFAKNTTAAFILSQSGLEEENAESILDHHCNRIWSSSHHTPSRSPGRQSPLHKSPDRTATPRSKTKQAQLSASVAAEAVAASAIGHSFPRPHHRSKKDPTLSKSYDAGIVEEKVMRGETHRHIHHHHHHHHSREISNKQRLELETQQGGVFWREPSGFEYSRGRTNTKKSVVRKSSDAGSNIDSGISMMYETDSSRVVPNWNNPSSEKYVDSHLFYVYVHACVYVCCLLVYIIGKGLTVVIVDFLVFFLKLHGYVLVTAVTSWVFCLVLFFFVFALYEVPTAPSLCWHFSAYKQML